MLASSSAAAAAAAAAAAVSEQEQKRAIMKHLRETVWVKLAASPIEGVGVIAIRDIPADTNPFACVNEHLKSREEFVSVTAKELKALAPEVGDLAKSFFAPLDDDASRARPDVPRDEATLVYGVNATGLHTLDISWYLNHSDSPSVRFVEAEHVGGFNGYKTTRLVPAGEELTVDYRELGVEYYLTGTAGDGDRRARLEDQLRKAREQVRLLEEELSGEGKI